MHAFVVGISLEHGVDCASLSVTLLFEFFSGAGQYFACPSLISSKLTRRHFKAILLCHGYIFGIEQRSRVYRRTHISHMCIDRMRSLIRKQYAQPIVPLPTRCLRILAQHFHPLRIDLISFTSATLFQPLQRHLKSAPIFSRMISGGGGPFKVRIHCFIPGHSNSKDH
jgi:hypothetical protein